MDEWTKVAAKQMFEADKPVDEIITELGITSEEFNALGLIPQTTIISKTLAEKIIAEYQDETLPIYRISVNNNISVTTVYRILAENNIPIRKIALKTAEQLRRENAIKLYQEGHSYDQIKRETGYSNATIISIVRAAGVPLRNRR